MNNRQKVIITLASVSIAYIILATALYVPYHSQDMYERHWDRAYMTLGQNQTHAIFNDLMQYLNQDYFGYERTHLLSGFTPSEQSHFRDVKHLLDWLRLQYIAAFAVLFLLATISTEIYRKKELKEMAARSILYGSIAPFVIMLLAGSAIGVNFSLFWGYFHHVFFPQGNWVFPSDSLMITLFPESLFREFSYWFIIIAAAISLLGLAAYRYFRKTKIKGKKAK